MEITIDTLISIATLLLGGGGGAFFTWRWQRKKAEVSAAKELQDMYQQMIHDKNSEVEDKNRIIAELREDRDHYKQEAHEMRDKMDKLTRNVAEWKNDSDERIRSLQAQVARNGRQIECLRPMLCARENCAIRMPMTITEAIEPNSRRMMLKNENEDKEDKE